MVLSDASASGTGDCGRNGLTGREGLARRGRCLLLESPLWIRRNGGDTLRSLRMPSTLPPPGCCDRRA